MKKNPLSGKTLCMVFLLIFFLPVIVFGDERIGGLVFNAMQKIQQNHQSFLAEVKDIKSARQKASDQRNTARKNFGNSPVDTLDRKQAHAEFCYAQAKYYRALFDEVKLTNRISKKQLEVLYGLKDSLKSEGGHIDAEGTIAILETTKPFLENSRSLMNSLSEQRHLITDPVINSKLNAAAQTAKMLSVYVNHIEKNKFNKNMQAAALQQKVSELINQLNSLYAQTDIMMAMVQDKTALLKMINQVSASEMGMWALTDGKKMINELSESVIDPLMDEYLQADEDLDILTEEVLDGGIESNPFGRGGSQKWTQVNF